MLFPIASCTLMPYEHLQMCKADSGRVKCLKLGANSGFESVLWFYSSYFNTN